MGQSQSATQASPSQALHVLRPFFDFVVGYEGDSLSQTAVDVAELERIVEAHEGRTLNLKVWNSKDQETRVVPIPSLLGLSMRICAPEFALDNVWHVLDVVEGSPAESAGLVPYGDYITGWSGGVLGAENDFYDLVEAHVDKPLRVYVYSHDFDALREVVLVPNRHWGGSGLLVVYGFIHRIPPRSLGHASTTISDIHEENLFVPVDDPRYSLEKWNSRGDDARSSDTVPLSRSAGSKIVSPIPEEDAGSIPHDHNHHHGHDHDHDHNHDHHHHESNLPSTPVINPSPSPSTRSSSRPFISSGLINGE
ncbi:GRASP55/65 PDZ-like domain-containing protein [Mucidula mucida]|nr:GRASP55/65 PDZ-like domain-containing protein [Mucidula mucida]